jgi:hypothetical protein
MLPLDCSFAWTPVLLAELELPPPLVVPATLVALAEALLAELAAVVALAPLVILARPVDPALVMTPVTTPVTAPVTAPVTVAVAAVTTPPLFDSPTLNELPLEEPEVAADPCTPTPIVPVELLNPSEAHSPTKTLYTPTVSPVGPHSAHTCADRITSSAQTCGSVVRFWR